MNRSAVWTIASSLVLAGLQVAQIILAARYLTAADFGHLAVAMSVMYVVLSVQEMGLGSFLVHVGELPRRGHATLFWTNVLLGTSGAVLLAVLAEPMSHFFNMPDADHLFLIVALNALALAVGSQYQGNLIRTFLAHRLGQIEVVVRIFSFALTCWLLIWEEFGVESILLGMLAYSAGRTAVMAVMAERHVHPVFAFDVELARRAINYGVYQSASSCVNQVRNQADQLLVAKLFVPEIAGLYFLAKELVSHPLRILEPLVVRLTLPVFARAQTDLALLSSRFRDATRRSAVVGGLIYCGVAFLSAWLIEVLYGPQYLAALPLVLALIVWGCARYIGLNVRALALATGWTGGIFRWTLWSTIVSIVVLLGMTLVEPSALSIAAAAAVIQIGVALVGPLFFASLGTSTFASFAKVLALGVFLALAGVGLALAVPLPSLEALLGKAYISWAPSGI